MRAAFSYYIHRPSTAAAVRLRQHFRLAASVSASLGWKDDPRPSNRSFFSPLFRAPLTFVQAHRGLCSSRSECSSMGGALPAMAECSCADPPPQAAEAPKGQPWPSGGRHSFRHATLAATRSRPGRPGWGFSVGPSLESRPPVESWRPRAETAAIQAHRWQGKSRCKIAAWPGRWLPRGFGLLAFAGWGPRLLPGPPGSPGTGRGRGGPG